MRITILIAIILFAININAQQKQIFACSYGSQRTANVNCINISNSINSDIEAIEIVDKILQPIGLKRNFVLVSCTNINNALAITSSTGIRYIVYDKIFINSLRQLSSDWTNASILAHEIGHHLLGHTLKASLSLEEQRQKELDADEFSGFILMKLGATLQQAQATISLVSSDASDINSTHPSRSKRLIAIRDGYNKAGSSQTIKYVKVGPDPEEFFIKAYKLTDEQRFEEAIENYTTAISLNKQFAEAYLNRAHARLQLPFKKFKFSDVIDDCNKAIQLRPDLGAAYYNKGLVEMLQSKYEFALKDFDYAVKLDPSLNDQKFFLNRSFVLAKLKDEGKTVSDLDKDISQNSNNAESYFNRGVQKMKLNLFNDAIIDFSKAIEIDHKNASYYDMRGWAKGKLRNYKEAIKDYDTSIRLKPDLYISYFNRGSTYKILEDFDKSLADFNVCVMIQPDNAEFIIERGYARRQVQAYDGALEDFTRLIELNPKNELGWLERAVTKAVMGKYKEAIDDLNQALSVNSNPTYLPYHYYHRGLCKIALGDKNGGCKDLKKSCELDSTIACEELKEYCK